VGRENKDGKGPGNGAIILYIDVYVFSLTSKWNPQKRIKMGKALEIEQLSYMSCGSHLLVREKTYTSEI
jgi:hypothetical protein